MSYPHISLDNVENKNIPQLLLIGTINNNDLTYVVDFRDVDTVAGEDSTAVDKSADSPSIADVDSVYSNTVVIG